MYGKQTCRGARFCLGRRLAEGSWWWPVLFFCVREIELSLALRKHVVIDTDGQRVTWLLPCSKTDPKALGKSRTWDCVCNRDFAKPCAYHALENHCRLLDTKFSGLSDGDSLPLFPDVTGKTVDKAKVVGLIEQLAKLMGLPITSEGGYRLYGGHSLRVSGAQWMARTGVSLPLIQLMARWSSNAIARYVADTPLETISEVYRRATAAKELRELIDEARRSSLAAQKRIGQHARRVSGLVLG